MSLAQDNDADAAKRARVIAASMSASHDDRFDAPMVRAVRSFGKRDRGGRGDKRRHETLEAIWTARQTLSFSQKFTWQLECTLDCFARTGPPRYPN
jgi:hypothetical protein